MSYKRAEASTQPVEAQLGGFERLRLSWRLFRDDRVPTWMKALVPVVAAIYVVAPIDLIPDLLLGPGQIDDIGVIGISIFVMTHLLPRIAPQDVIDDHLAEMGSGFRRQETRENIIDATFQIVEEPAQDARRRGFDGVQETRV